MGQLTVIELASPILIVAAHYNTHCQMIPPNHHLFLFTKGITTLSCMSGHKHKKMASILLGLIIDLHVSGSSDLTHIIKAIHMLMDLLFLAQYKSHTSDTLTLL